VVYDLPEDPYRIARHVDSRHCGHRFFPPEWVGIHEILISEFENRFEDVGFKLNNIHYIPSIADVGERAMSVRHKERRYGPGCVDQWRRNEDALQTKLDRLLEPMDRRLSVSPFLLGQDPVFADCALYGVLGNYTYNNWNGLPDRMKALRDWFDRLTQWRVGK
jgi:glutathione S-transferase